MIVFVTTITRTEEQTARINNSPLRHARDSSALVLVQRDCDIARNGFLRTAFHNGVDDDFFSLSMIICEVELEYDGPSGTSESATGHNGNGPKAVNAVSFAWFKGPTVTGADNTCEGMRSKPPSILDPILT